MHHKFPQKGNYNDPTIKTLLHPFPMRSKEWLDFAKIISRSVHGPSESDIYKYFGYDSAVPALTPSLTPESSAADPAQASPPDPTPNPSSSYFGYAPAQTTVSAGSEPAKASPTDPMPTPASALPQQSWRQVSPPTCPPTHLPTHSPDHPSDNPTTRPIWAE